MKRINDIIDVSTDLLYKIEVIAFGVTYIAKCVYTTMYRSRFIPIYRLDKYDDNKLSVTNNELEYIYNTELNINRYNIYELSKSEYPQYYI
jgi:hypothetical protein